MTTKPKLSNAEWIAERRECMALPGYDCTGIDVLREALSRLEAAEKRNAELEDMKPFAESVAAKTAIGLSKTIEQLRTENTRLESEIYSLNCRVEELKRENAELEETVTELENRPVGEPLSMKEILRGP